MSEIRTDGHRGGKFRLDVRSRAEKRIFLPSVRPSSDTYFLLGSSNSSPILLLQKGLCLDTALQLANELIYQSELVAGQQNEVNSF